jgi:hypothetical protein
MRWMGNGRRMCKMQKKKMKLSSAPMPIQQQGTKGPRTYCTVVWGMDSVMILVNMLTMLTYMKSEKCGTTRD